jgi:hypothetical protein
MGPSSVGHYAASDTASETPDWVYGIVGIRRESSFCTSNPVGYSDNKFRSTVESVNQVWRHRAAGARRTFSDHVNADHTIGLLQSG